MAVAHSSDSESHTGTTGSTNQTSFSWTHTQTGTPQGVLVFVHTISASNFISSVTYGGTALTRVTGAVAIDTAGEPGRTDMFFLGSGLGSGNQTITVNRTNNATIMYASAATVTAGADVNVTGIQVLQNNQTLVELAIDDGSSGIDSLRYAAAYYGANSPASAGANSTQLTSIDLGSFGNSMVVENTAGQGARNVGFQGGADDLAAVFVAVREVTAWSTTGETGSFTLTGNDATLTVTAVKAIAAELGTFTLTGNPADFARQYSITIDAGGFTLTGNPADLRHNIRIEGGTGAFSLTGNAATLTKATAKELLPIVGAFSLTGNQAGLTQGYAITADRGAFTLTGNPATLADTDQLDATAGTFSLTGNAATLKRGSALAGDRGAFTLTGQQAGLAHAVKLGGGTGAFTLTGNQAGLAQGYALAGGTGAFTLTGNNATLTKAAADELSALVGTFSLTGNGATLSRSRLFAADRGQFTLAGQAASLRQGWRAAGDRGQFLLTGNPAALAADHSVLGAIGAFTLTGNPAKLAAADELDAVTGVFTLTGNAASLAKSGGGGRRRVVFIF